MIEKSKTRRQEQTRLFPKHDDFIEVGWHQWVGMQRHAIADVPKINPLQIPIKKEKNQIL